MSHVDPNDDTAAADDDALLSLTAKSFLDTPCATALGLITLFGSSSSACSIWAVCFTRQLLSSPAAVVYAPVSAARVLRSNDVPLPLLYPTHHPVHLKLSRSMAMMHRDLRHMFSVAQRRDCFEPLLSMLAQSFASVVSTAATDKTEPTQRQQQESSSVTLTQKQQLALVLFMATTNNATDIAIGALNLRAC